MTAAPANRRAGACLWLTGLSGAGKTTTARAVAQALCRDDRLVTVLDGDELRASISADLGFSRADRDAHVRRVAAIARDIVERGDIAICALVSPFRDARAAARALIGSDRFLEIFVSSPLHICEQRDPKGLYRRARRGELTHFTGVDDPYEPPIAPELVITTVECSVEENVSRILALLLPRWSSGASSLE